MAAVLHVSALVSYAIVKQVQITEFINNNKIKITFIEDLASVGCYSAFYVFLPLRNQPFPPSDLIEVVFDILMHLDPL